MSASAVLAPAFASVKTADGLPGPQGANTRLRFLLASDGHYAQPGTNYAKTHQDIVNWINQEHATSKLDFVVFNGDIVHDRPDLLKEVRDTYFRQLNMPFYALPGNHDHADTALWKQVFGYEDNYSIEHADTALVLGNTSNTKGDYLCPDINFLKREFEKHKAKKVVLVVLHIPIYQWLKEEDFYTTCTEVLNLIHSYRNIKAIFHGHDHSMDGVRYTDRLPHFFDGHYGGSWGTEYYGYRMVEIDDSYKLSTWQVNASQNPVLNKTTL